MLHIFRITVPRDVDVCEITFETKTYIMNMTQCCNCFIYEHTQIKNTEKV